MSFLDSAANEPGTHSFDAALSPLAGVLVIDDEEIYRTTLEVLLKAEGFDVVTASSGEEGLELLRGREFEVAIADLLMPGMDGIQTIAALKEVEPDIELIILTGHATVDSAIAALRQGACDFLQKPTGMAQLRPALLRALKKRRGDVASEESGARSVIANAPEAIVLLDREGVVQDFNPQAEHFLGWSREEALGRNLADFAIPLRLRDSFRKHLETAYREGKDPQNGCLEVYALRRNGEEFPIEISSAVIEAPQGKRLSTFVRDITERKRVLEALWASEEQFRELTENIHEVFFLGAPDPLRFTYISPAYEEIWGRPCQDLYERADAWMDSIPPEDRQAAINLFTEVNQGKRSHAEYRVVRPDGSVRHIRSRALPLFDGEGRFYRLVGIAEDITKLKQAEKASREIEDKLQVIFDGVEAGIFLIDPETHRIVDANPPALNLIGTKRHAVVGAMCHKFVCPADCGRCPVTDLGQEVDNSERVLLTFTGERLPIIKTVRPVVTAGRHLLLESFVDISARKKAELALRESEDRYRDWVESSSLLIGTHDAQGRILSVNRSAANYLESPSAEDLIGRSLTDFVPSDLRGKFADYLNAVLVQGHAEGLMVIANPSGKRKIIEYRNTLRREDVKEPIVRWSAQDVTERIQAEEALRVSENRYRLLFERNLAGVLRTTWEGRILECNESMARLLGYDVPKELVGADLTEFWDDPSDRRRMLNQLSEHESLSNFEVRFRRKNGKPVWALLNIHQNRPEGGQSPILESTVVDITQRKEAEEGLLFTQFSIDHASDAIAWLDSQGRIVYVNEAACRSFGRTREELLSLSISDIDPDFPSGTWEESWERTKAAGSLTFEARHITKLGQVFPVEVTANHLEFGGKEYSFTFSRDITQRKEAERQINLQVTALKAAANGIVITDRKGQILWANPAFTRLTGYDAEEVMGQSPRLLKSGIQDSGFYQELWRTIMSGEVWQGQLVNRRKDGTLYTEEMTVTPVPDGSGVITHFIAIKQDITDRKRAEASMAERHRLATLVAEVGVALTGAESLRHGLQRCAEILYAAS